MTVTDQVIRLDLVGSGDPGATRYSLVNLSEDQVRDLASGYVPRVLQAMALGLPRLAG